MTIQILGGSTSQTVRLFIQDTSKTDGSGLTGLVHNTSGLTAYYSKGATGTATAITLATQTAGGAWTSGGFVAVDGTNMPGVYRLDIPNAALDSEVETIVMLRGAANMAPVLLRVMGGKSQANAVTVADKTGYSLSTAGVNAVADGVCDELLSGHTTPGTVGYILGGVLIATNFNQRTVQVTGSNHVAVDIHELQPAVINNTHFAAGAIDDNALAASAVTEIQSGLATSANQTTILARLGAFTGTGINTVLGFLRAMASKAASTPSDIAGTYSATTDSLEAIRDAQAAGTGDASQATLEAVQDTVDAIAAKVSGGLIEVTSRVATGGNITLYIGDDARVRSGTEIEVTISDVGGTIYSRLNTLGVANLAWGASRRGLNAGAIAGTISGLSQSGSGATQVLTFAIEIDDAGDDLLPHDDYNWQIVSTSASGDEWVEVEGTLDLRRRVAMPV